MTSTITPIAVTFTCARCSRATTDPKGDHWFIRATPLVIQGVTLGLCASCVAGNVPSEPDEQKPCDGDCKGNFRPTVGTYFEAVLEGSWSSGDEKWACWDEACVDAWAEEHGGDCETCGHDRDVDVHQYANGKRVRS